MTVNLKRKAFIEIWRFMIPLPQAMTIIRGTKSAVNSVILL